MCEIDDIVGIVNIDDIEEHYEVLGPIGDGGQGDIFSARHRLSGERVALKTQKPRQFGPSADFYSAARTLSEEGSHLRALTGIEGIPEVMAIGSYDGRRCLVMEFLEGRQLRDCLSARRPVKDLGVVASVIGQLCEILYEVHEKGLVHCDVKPENVLVEPDGRLRLIDMGYSVRKGEQTQYAHGTLGYASPEQCDASPKGLTRQADIFALGCVLLEMTVMSLPYGGLYERPLKERPVLPPDRLAAIPPEFKDLALHMIELNPEDRPADVLEVFDGIRRHLPPVGSRRPLKPLTPDTTEYYRARPPRL
ncbi:serine/threonine protein kinase [Streptomyces sp. NPDC048718]|uniref:serine/threonine protein kinase n=1 Tax=Streptomyces sp. NPDC048718 TaxID=3365587 RepID=UPI003723C34F